MVEPGDARPHGERVVERVPAVEVVGAVADDEADRRGEAAGQQQGEQVAGGVVGPVHVLDDDEGGLRGAARGQQGVDGLGDLARVGRAAGTPTWPIRTAARRCGRGRAGRERRSGAGQQVAQARMGLEHAVDDLGMRRVEGSDELDEGEVGERAAGLTDAVAHGRRPAGCVGVGEQLGEQP